MRRERAVPMGLASGDLNCAAAFEVATFRMGFFPVVERTAVFGGAGGEHGRIGGGGERFELGDGGFRWGARNRRTAGWHVLAQSRRVLLQGLVHERRAERCSQLFLLALMRGRRHASGARSLERKCKGTRINEVQGFPYGAREVRRLQFGLCLDALRKW